MDIQNWIREQQERNLRAVEANKAAVKEFCSKHNVDRAELEFDGCGDSGQIERVTFFRAGDATPLDLDQEKVQITRISHSYVDGKHVDNIEESTGVAEDLFEEIAYHILEVKHPGWEINEGSFGVVIINADGSGKMQYNERIESIEYSEDTF
jgi:hypothetical protein